MSSKIVRHEYNGSMSPQRKEDGYVCLTDMAKATGKKVAHYFELKSTNAYLEGLSTDIGITISALVETTKGGDQLTDQGTWAHPEIAIDFAKWWSVPFRIWANRTLRHVIEEQSVSAPEPMQLPPADVRIRDYANAMQYLEEKLGIDLQNPRMQQQYQDVINNIVLDGQKQLPPSGSPKPIRMHCNGE